MNWKSTNRDLKRLTKEDVMKKYQKPKVVGSSNVHPC